MARHPLQDTHLIPSPGGHRGRGGRGGDRKSHFAELMQHCKCSSAAQRAESVPIEEQEPRQFRDWGVGRPGAVYLARLPRAVT
jgi:hypothetical protein